MTGASRAVQRLLLAAAFSPLCYAFLCLLLHYGERHLPEGAEFLEGFRRYAWFGAAL